MPINGENMQLIELDPFSVDNGAINHHTLINEIALVIAQEIMSLQREGSEACISCNLYFALWQMYPLYKSYKINSVHCTHSLHKCIANKRVDHNFLETVVHCNICQFMLPGFLGCHGNHLMEQIQYSELAFDDQSHQLDVDMCWN